MAQNPDLHLWRAVLVLGLHDAATGADPAWIGSRDFVQVCYLAQGKSNVLQILFWNPLWFISSARKERDQPGLEAKRCQLLHIPLGH